jgi:hypothetical protein
MGYENKRSLGQLEYKYDKDFIQAPILNFSSEIYSYSHNILH